MYTATIASSRYVFPDLKTLLAKASPVRSGDQLAGIAAASGEERVAAQYALADVPLASVLEQPVIPYESDEVTRLIVDSHDRAAFGAIAHLTVGGLRDWLLSDPPTAQTLAALARGITPEMAAAVAKISGLKDLMLMAAKCAVVTRFRDTIGLPGRLSVRLQPNHPTDDLRAIAASILDGLLLGAGDAVIGINPATDSTERAHALLAMLDEVRAKLDIPTQTCVLAHVTTTLALIAKGARGRARAQARHRRRQRDVFRDRARQRAFGRCASRRRPADARGPRLRRRARVLAAPHQHRGRLHRAGIPLRRQADHPRRARGSFLRQAARPAHGLRRLLHQPRRGRPGRHGRAADAAHRRRRQLRDGRARRRRHHARLSEHVVPRRARHARSLAAPPGAGIRGLARAPRPDRRRRAHPPARHAQPLPRAPAGVTLLPLSSAHSRVSGNPARMSHKRVYARLRRAMATCGASRISLTLIRATKLTPRSSLPGLTRQSILFNESAFSDGCPGQARA